MSNATVDITSASGVDLTTLYDQFLGITTYAQVDDTEFTATNPSTNIDFEFHGANLTYDANNKPDNSGAPITEIVLKSGGVQLAVFDFSAGGGLSSLNFIAAIDQFQANHDHSLLDNFFNVIGFNLDGGAGADAFTGYGTNDDILSGNGGNDNLRGGAGNDTLNGNDNNDQLYGDAGDDTINGGDGDDWLDGGAGKDTIDGGAGAQDAVTYLSSDAAVTVTLGANGAQTIGKGGYAEGDKITNVERIIGTGYNDVLTGNELGNQFAGYGGTDKIDGGAGNDFIEGDGGADTLIGGTGVDTVVYDGDTTGVTVTLGANGAQTTGHGGQAEGDLISGFENIRGSGYSDVLTGNNLVNAIYGQAGDDLIQGGGGADFLDGGGEFYAGEDTVSYSASTAGVTVSINLTNATTGHGGDAEGDTLIGFYNIIGSSKNDVLSGDANVNSINGGSGNDVIEGGAGSDTLDGGGGVDTVSYAHSVDVNNDNAGVSIVLLDGNSQASASGDDAQGDILTHFTNIIGTNYNDILAGNSAANTIDGGDGDDSLSGGGGNDTLTGGAGDDLFFGGAGADTFVGGANGLFGDTADYFNNSVAVTLALGKDGTQTIAHGGNAEGDKVSQIEDINGTLFNDVLTGNNLTNRLYGNDGDDIIEGGAEVDVLTGGAGNDTVSYAGSSAGVTVEIITAGQSFGVGGDAESDNIEEFENITGSKFNDALTGDEADNVIDGGAGDDVIEGGAGVDILKGGLGNDTLSYKQSATGVTVTLDSANEASVSGGDAASDTATGFENLLGSANNDKLTGDGGNNIIEGGDGDDTLAGGLGIDTLSYASASAGVTVDLSKAAQQDTVGAGKDTISGFENIIGSDSNDTLIGDGNANKISGGTGDDFIRGGGGADVLDGGAGGLDTLDYSTDTKGVTVTLGVNGAQTTASGPAGSEAAGDKIANFENITGGSGNDVLTGNLLTNVIHGGGGDDTIIAGLLKGSFGGDLLDGDGGNNTLSFASTDCAVDVSLVTGQVGGNFGSSVAIANFYKIIGSSLDDTFIGNDNGNTFDGGAGNDLVRGGKGDDVLIGGAGNNTVSYQFNANAIHVDLTKVGVAQDTVSAGKDTLSGFENVIGGDGGGTIIGDNANNNLRGGGGSDGIMGGGGDDTIEGGGTGAGSDSLDGGLGNDTVSFAHASAGVTVSLAITMQQNTGGAGKVTLQNFENIQGSDGVDHLTGDAKANIINGGGQQDYIEGGAGADTIDGGDFVDTILYTGSAAGVTVTLGKDGAQTVGVGGDAAGDKIKNVEFITGSSQNDVLTGNNLDNFIDGGAGDDLIQGGASEDMLTGGGNAHDTISYSASAAGVTIALNDTQTTNGTGGDAEGDQISGFRDIIGSAKDDDLAGSVSANIIDGGAGNDTIEGGLGDDTLKGGTGIDTVSYSTAATGVTVDLTNVMQQDTVGAGKDTLSGFENITGSIKNDNLTGDNKDNVIDGGLGDDILIGGGGNDTVSYVSATGVVHADLNLVGVQQNSFSAGQDTLTGFRNLFGSSHNDTFTGDGNNNILTGNDGDDLLIGNGGADTLDGGAGNDVLKGGAGADTIIGGADNQDLVDYSASALGVTVTLGAGGAQTTASGGDAAGDKISGVEWITGSAKNDVLAGNNLINLINGGDGDDIVQGGSGGDHLDGGNGNDTLSYSSSTAGVTVDIGNNVANGGDAQGDFIGAFENVTGSDFGDTLRGSNTANVIIGGKGDDWVAGRDGADTLDGGVGNDTVSYEGEMVGVTVTLGAANVETIGHGGFAEGDKIKNFENIEGSDADDILTGNAGNNTIKGFAGDDIIDGGLGNDMLDGGTHVNGDTLSYASVSANVTVDLSHQGVAQNTGGAGTDTFTGFTHLIGGDGSDLLTGDYQDNHILGGVGNDTISGHEGADTLDGGSNGATGDTVSYATSGSGVTVDLTLQGSNLIPATAQEGGDAQGDLLFGFENVTGSAFDDILTGDTNANVLNGGAGNDTLSGGAGNDNISGGNDSDLIDGGVGADTLDGGNGIDTVSYANSNSNVTVTLGANGAQTTTSGATGSDAIGDKISNFENVVGSAFNDKLTGNAGNNVIHGGAGPDTMAGGAGADEFSYANVNEGGDIITDFVTGTDKIGIDKSAFAGGLQGYNADTILPDALFISGPGATSPDNSGGYFTYDTTSHKLFWDDDGTDGNAPHLIATFSNNVDLHASDIILR